MLQLTFNPGLSGFRSTRPYGLNGILQWSIYSPSDVFRFDFRPPTSVSLRFVLLDYLLWKVTVFWFLFFSERIIINHIKIM